MVEGARLESVYTVTPYRGFESLLLRHFRSCLWEFSKTLKSPRFREFEPLILRVVEPPLESMSKRGFAPRERVIFSADLGAFDALKGKFEPFADCVL